MPSRICPRLAFSADRRHVADSADADHVCTAQRPAQWLDRSRQLDLCLSETHLDCPRFVEYQARLAVHRHDDPSAPALQFVSSRLTLHPDPVWRGLAGRAAQPAGRRIVAGAAGAAVLGLAAAAVAGAALPGVASAPQSAPIASLVPTASTRLLAPSPATAAPTVEATPSGQPTVTPAPELTASLPPPTATAPPTAAPQRTYVVQDGDTLAVIADLFGVELEALQAANGITDPDEIEVGTVLVLP